MKGIVPIAQIRRSQAGRFGCACSQISSIVISFINRIFSFGPGEGVPLPIRPIPALRREKALFNQMPRVRLRRTL
jgi:hypothetical protein